MTAQPKQPFAELEILGDDDAAVCGPDGCELPAPPNQDTTRAESIEPHTGD